MSAEAAPKAAAARQSPRHSSTCRNHDAAVPPPDHVRSAIVQRLVMWLMPHRPIRNSKQWQFLAAAGSMPAAVRASSFGSGVVSQQAKHTTCQEEYA